MSRTRHQNKMVTLLDALNANAAGRKLVYTETLVFPDYNVGTGNDIVWESDQTYRAKVLWMGFNEITTAIANSPTFGVGSSAGNFAYVASLTVPAVAVRTNIDDSDASADLDRITLPGTSRVIPASQAVTGTGTNPGTATGIGTLYVVVGYFV